MQIQIIDTNEKGYSYVVTSLTEESKAPYRDDKDKFLFAIKMCNITIANLKCKLEKLNA